KIGAGKTSLGKILSGLERHYQGEVFLSGQDIRNYQHQSLRNAMAIVSQNPFLFGDTVKNNICMDRELSNDEVWHYLEIADVAKDVKGFKDGLDTVVGEN